jgi:flagella basal body P-ring formation protein FlgA
MFLGSGLPGVQAETSRDLAVLDPDQQRLTIQKRQPDQIIPESKFRELLQDYICDSMGRHPADIAISRLKISGNRRIAGGDADFQIFQKSKGVPKGYVRVTVIVSVDDMADMKVNLSAWVDVFGSVVCTVRKLNKGEIVGPADIYLVRKNMARMPENVITDKSKALGLSVKNSLNANTSLRDYMLIRKPTVERGDMVTILAQLGGLKVTTPGKTLERGFEGDLIRVQNTMSKKKIYARIVDDSTVEVDF